MGRIKKISRFFWQVTILLSVFVGDVFADTFADTVLGKTQNTQISTIDTYISNAIGLGIWVVLVGAILAGLVAVAIGISKMWSDDPRDKDTAKQMIGWGMVAFMFAFAVIGTKQFIVGDGKIAHKDIYDPIGSPSNAKDYAPYSSSLKNNNNNITKK